RWGRLDVAVNNAGVADTLAPLHKIDEAQYDRIMAINAKGVFLGMKAQIPVMLAAQSGAIVNVASAAGLLGAAQMAAYAASKHAVVGLTRAAADEVARQGIRVNALCPSFAHTPLFSAVTDEFSARLGLDEATAHDKITARIPMRRVVTPSEVVQAILWASAPENTFFTGQALSIDGGLTAV
ncbi:MAG: SDR family NAD(P)-dependent oxidoreductase, partial [Paracoccaceae bacterium]